MQATTPFLPLNPFEALPQTLLYHVEERGSPKEGEKWFFLEFFQLFLKLTQATTFSPNWEYHNEGTFASRPFPYRHYAIS